ncbi:MAG: VirB8/TrbF family protein [Acidobacteriota bacterium]
MGKRSPVSPKQPPRLKAFFAGNLLALRVSAAANLALLGAVVILGLTLHGINAQVKRWQPVVIRVDKAGSALPVDLTVDKHPASLLEAKAFSAQYIEDLQSFDPNNLNRDMGRALAVTGRKCRTQLVQYFRTDAGFHKLVAESSLVFCHVEAVQLVARHPMEMQITYRLQNLKDNTTSHWYALLTLKHAPRSFTNPFGLLVTGVRITQKLTH